MVIETDKFGAKTISDTINGKPFKITYHGYTEEKAIASFKESVENLIANELKKKQL